MLETIFHGHSFVEITDGERCILIDPFVTGNKYCDLSLEQLTTKKINAIVVTHGHSDHIGDAVAIAQHTPCTIIATFELVQRFQQQGLENLSAQSIGGQVDYTDFSVKFTPAIHGGYIDGSSITTVAAGVLIKIDGHTIYHAGDTALTLDMQLLGKYETIDLALLPIGDRYTMGIDDAVHAVEMISPSYVVPIHYNTRPQITVDPLEFARKVMQLGGPVPKVLNPGQALVLS